MELVNPAALAGRGLSMPLSAGSRIVGSGPRRGGLAVGVVSLLVWFLVSDGLVLGVSAMATSRKQHDRKHGHRQHAGQVDHHVGHGRAAHSGAHHPQHRETMVHKGKHKHASILVAVQATDPPARSQEEEEDFGTAGSGDEPQKKPTSPPPSTASTAVTPAPAPAKDATTGMTADMSAIYLWDEDVRYYGPCLVDYRELTLKENCPYYDDKPGGVTLSFAHCVQDEMGLLNMGYIAGQARKAIVQHGVGADIDEEAASSQVRHVLQKCKAFVAFKCAAPASDCAEQGISQSDMPSSIGKDKMCPAKCLEMEPLSGGDDPDTWDTMRLRVKDVAHAFRDVPDPEVAFEGGSADWGAALAVCHHVALVGKGGPHTDGKIPDAAFSSTGMYEPPPAGRPIPSLEEEGEKDKDPEQDADKGGAILVITATTGKDNTWLFSPCVQLNDPEDLPDLAQAKANFYSISPATWMFPNPIVFKLTSKQLESKEELKKARAECLKAWETFKEAYYIKTTPGLEPECVKDQAGDDRKGCGYPGKVTCEGLYNDKAACEKARNSQVGVKNPSTSYESSSFYVQTEGNAQNKVSKCVQGSMCLGEQEFETFCGPDKFPTKEKCQDTLWYPVKATKEEQMFCAQGRSDCPPHGKKLHSCGSALAGYTTEGECQRYGLKTTQDQGVQTSFTLGDDEMQVGLKNPNPTSDDIKPTVIATTLSIESDQLPDEAKQNDIKESLIKQLKENYGITAQVDIISVQFGLEEEDEDEDEDDEEANVSVQFKVTVLEGKAIEAASLQTAVETSAKAAAVQSGFANVKIETNPLVQQGQLNVPLVKTQVGQRQDVPLVQVQTSRPDVPLVQKNQVQTSAQDAPLVQKKQVQPSGQDVPRVQTRSNIHAPAVKTQTQTLQSTTQKQGFQSTYTPPSSTKSSPVDVRSSSTTCTLKDTFHSSTDAEEKKFLVYDAANMMTTTKRQTKGKSFDLVLRIGQMFRLRPLVSGRGHQIYQIQSVSRDFGASWIDLHPLFDDVIVKGAYIHSHENGNEICDDKQDVGGSIVQCTLRDVFRPDTKDRAKKFFVYQNEDMTSKKKRATQPGTFDLVLRVGQMLRVSSVGDVYQIQSVSRDGGASWIDKHPMFNDAKVANKFIKKIENGKDVCSGNTATGHKKYMN